MRLLAIEPKHAYDHLRVIDDCIGKIRESLERLAEETRKAICALTADETEAEDETPID